MYKYLILAGVDEETARAIDAAPYPGDDNEKQDAANRHAAMLRMMTERLDGETLRDVMFHRACCKTGSRLKNARTLAKEHAGEPLPKKLEALAALPYMGTPTLTESGDIDTGPCAGTILPGGLHRCSCWQLGGKKPVQGSMPTEYCLCCAGHFRFHYEKALGLKLRVKAVRSSAFEDRTQGCAFVLSIQG